MGHCGTGRPPNEEVKDGTK
jgi:hypothetical protein